jgi:hypothetical protein
LNTSISIPRAFFKNLGEFNGTNKWKDKINPNICPLRCADDTLDTLSGCRTETAQPCIARVLKL